MSKKSTSRTMRRVTGASLSGALVGGMMLAATPVQAADDVVEVTAGEIRGNEDTYAGWHQGYSDAELAFGLTKDGLSMAGKSQVIRGYADNDNADLADDGVNADLDEVLLGASYDVKAGAARFQVPLFVDLDNNAETPGDFTTLRPDAAATGDTAIKGDDMWVSSKALGTVEANTPTPLSVILAVIGAHESKTLGFGVLTVPGEAGTVSSINWDSKKYVFKADAVTTTTVDDDDVYDEETSSNYTKWHQGYAGSTARHQVTEKGLVLAGKSQVVKGYSNNSTHLNAINANLQFALLDASYTVEAGSDNVFFQVPLRSENIAGSQFATLRNSGAGAGTNTFSLDDNWQSSKAIGSIPANTDAKLGDIIAALGNYKVIGFGVLTNPGDSATVSNVTFDGKSFDFAESPAAAADSESVKAVSIAADEDVYKGWHQGSTTGETTVEDDILKLGATKSQIIKGYSNNNGTLNARNVNLGEALTSASYTVKAGTVHFQVPMFVEDPDTGDSTFTTLRPAAPAEVGSNTISIGDEWVSSKAVGTIAANTPVLLGDILSEFTTYKVIAFGVFSDDGGNGEVSDITWDGVKYTFASALPPAVKYTTGRTTAGKEVTVKLGATDPDGGELTYTAPEMSVSGGTVTVEGDELKYTPKKGFGGYDSVVVTVADDNEGESKFLVGIKVNAVRPSMSLKLSPKAPTSKSRITATVKVVVPDTVVAEGANVYIFDGRKRIGAAKMDADGTISVKVSKLKKGTHKVTARFYGTKSVARTDRLRTLKIKK